MIVSRSAACSILCANHALVGSRRFDRSGIPDMDPLHTDLDPTDYSWKGADFE